MLALSLGRKGGVDFMNEAAAANGGVADINPMQDHGFMHSRDFAGPDGHVWKLFWMEMDAIPQNE